MIKLIKISSRGKDSPLTCPITSGETLYSSLEKTAFFYLETEMSEENLGKVQSDLKKVGGLRKYLKLQLLKNWPNFLKVLITALLIPAGVSYFVSSTTVKNEISSKIENTIKNEVAQHFYLGGNTQNKTLTPKESDNQTVPPASGVSLQDFKENEWIFCSQRYDLTKDSFYCPGKVNFPSWFMWTKKKFLIEREVQIRFKLRDNTKNNKPPTLLVSYGDKTGDAPEGFYRINVLDGDFKTIRVYAENRNYEDFDRAEQAPNLDNDLLIILRPNAPSQNPKISLNPELSFKLENDEVYSFIPDKDFNFGVPLVSISQQGDGKQFGLGVSKGDCFKIISSNLF